MALTARINVMFLHPTLLVCIQLSHHRLQHNPHLRNASNPSLLSATLAVLTIGCAKNGPVPFSLASTSSSTQLALSLARANGVTQPGSTW